MVKPIADGYPRVLPYLSVDGAAAEIDFLGRFYGDRAGQFIDPSGHKWFVATHIEDVDDGEMARRAAAAMGG